MSDRLESLIQKVYHAEHQALHHKLEALQGQMNPHFMYNMLEGIQSNIALDKPEKATRIILELSHYLRIVLSRGEEEIPLREEIQMVKGFLHLVEMVYKKGHSYNITVSEQLLARPIIRFTLQPIVENSIIHGFHNSDPPLEISITCRTEDEKLIIIISDNGCGIEPQRLANLNSHLQSPIPGFDSFGLTNVQTRIRLLYGEEYGLIVESTESRGTTTIVTCPLKDGVSNG
jgi:two-component system sensor histidine kinase YesM